jgi:hypothetical protein
MTQAASCSGVSDCSTVIYSRAAEANPDAGLVGTQDILMPYLDPLLSKLVMLLLGGHRIVQEQAITAIASVADCVAEGFVQYYSRIMPTLKQMLVQCK